MQSCERRDDLMTVYCQNSQCSADLTKRIKMSYTTCGECGREIPYYTIHGEGDLDAPVLIEDDFGELDIAEPVLEDYEPEDENVENPYPEVDGHDELLSDIVSDLLDSEKTRPLDVSNPTLKEFGIQLLELLRNSEEENLKQRSLMTYPVQQMIESALKPYSIYHQDIVLFFTNLTRSWDQNKVYFPGDSLVRVNFSSGYKDGFISLVAGFANSRVDPFSYFFDPKKFDRKVWRLFIEAEGTLSEFDTNSKLVQPATANFEWLQGSDISLICYSCNTSHRLKSGLLSDQHSPAKGLCSDCKSTKHTTFLVGQHGSLASSPIIFDPASEQFFISFSNDKERIELREVWEEYQRTGDIDIIDFNPGDPAESMADLLKIELRLHRIAAEMYAKLRGIPVTNPNNNLKSKGLLRELDWLNNQVKLFVEKVEKN